MVQLYQDQQYILYVSQLQHLKYKDKNDGVNTAFVKREAAKYGVNVGATNDKNLMKAYINQGYPLVATGMGMKPFGTNSYHGIAITGKDGKNVIIQNPESKTSNNLYNMN